MPRTLDMDEEEDTPKGDISDSVSDMVSKATEYYAKRRDPATPPESFETALPVAAHPSAPAHEPVTPKIASRTPHPDRSPPHSPEAEEHVIACCLLDSGATLDRATESGLTPDQLYSPANRLIYSTLLALRRAEQPVELDTLAQALKDKQALASVGGFAYLMQITGRIPTTAHAGFFIQTVKEKAIRRTLIAQATGLVEQAYNGVELSDLLDHAELLAAHRSAPVTAKPRAISTYAYPSDDDPGLLLGADDYLGRGGGFLFVSHAGAGKSSWIMDACMSWAIGRPWMGIACHPRAGSHGLKSLIIQAEDSDRYIGKVTSSFIHANSLAADTQALLGQNCIITRLKGVSGPAFFSALKRLTDQHEPDLVVINPLYLYADGDIGRSEFAQPFLLGLDRVNCEEKFGYILVHHTGKPAAKGKDGRRAEVEDWESVYMGFGSSYLANWPRCSALLEPIPANPGHYQIKLGKGGFNAGITKEVPHGAGFRLEPSTRIPIKHSTSKMLVDGRERPVYYWEADEATPESEALKTPLGRPAKYDAQKLIACVPPPDAKPMALNQIFRLVGELPCGISIRAFKDLMARWLQSGEVARVEGQGTLGFRRTS